ncbi:glycosyltransferase [Chitinophaga rhizophila]|uniref:Glycosyltransferase family 2 protein n=1 Tax=Chitinophaga rhizophila TaxID=2866212 RepID=A0ABS7G603_9BACT|nr:glycosyltransferase family A protein [Chitinophaga rhizophila]MBW8683062.1 glycosyltransferase family 2 protein [Chitinophaga rhizophila]
MKKLSFCITCKNRFHQIEQTLPVNLKMNRAHHAAIEFVLVDFGSKDGLQEHVLRHFREELELGYLRYYYTSAMDSWHASIAKNTAHALSVGEVLVNLDCDNFTGENGGQFILDLYDTYGPDVLLHQFSGHFADGSFGRIGMAREHFMAIGGYNESFLPMGYQDIDLIKRLMRYGLRYELVNDPAYNTALVNTKEDSMRNTQSRLSYKEMNRYNFNLSRENLLKGEINTTSFAAPGMNTGLYQYVNGSMAAIS